ncbi:MAG: hypothetical protein KF784_11265 [Fimbriimonadaceae bacterium]|nr:hypothetical protein [Fimbriimonadaceae bacterium]
MGSRVVACHAGLALVLMAGLGLQSKPSKDHFMRVANYRVGSLMDDPNAAGGYGKSDNYAIAGVPPNVGPGARNRRLFRIVASRDDKAGSYIYLISKSSQVLSFDAFDSALNMVLEAKTADGEWLPVEFRHRITCGNSRHQVFLAGLSYWRMPLIGFDSGPTKTQMRVRMLVPDPDIKDPVTLKPVYSNVFEGFVHPESFTLSPEDAKVYKLQKENGWWDVVWRGAADSS